MPEILESTKLSVSVELHTQSTVVAVVRTGHHIQGQFRTLPGNGLCLQGDINTPKWNQALEFALSCARLLEAAHKIKHDSINCSPRIVSSGGKEVDAQIALYTQAPLNIDGSLSRKVLSCFSHGVSAQSLLKFKEDTIIRDQSMIKLIETYVAEFTKTKGGQTLSKQLQVLVDETPVCTVSGSWATSPIKPEKEVAMRSIDCFYDGRRLRDRTLFLKEADGRGTNHAVSYDEVKFDAQLRSFNEDKNVALRAAVEIHLSGQTCKRVVLARLEQIPLETELKLKA